LILAAALLRTAASASSWLAVKALDSCPKAYSGLARALLSSSAI
jgi:hypothetical protein